MTHPNPSLVKDVASSAGQTPKSADGFMSPKQKKIYRPHPGLIAAAQRIFDRGEEHTVTGITTALISKFRTQGKRITEGVREDCYQAADIVMEEDRQRCVEAWENAVELCAND